MLRSLDPLHLEVNPTTLKCLSDELAATPKRNFPWRNTSNPYNIMVAELLLQRTLPHHAVSVYKEIMSRYPDVCSLATAERKDLSCLIAPLGLKKRVDLMLAASRHICEKLNGIIPSNYKELLKVPSIGPYAAAAIMSLVHKETIAMVDVNTARIVSRTLSVVPKASSPQKDKVIIAIADAIVACNPQESREINFGFLDVGALHCRSRPKCLSCPLKSKCNFYRQHN